MSEQSFLAKCFNLLRQDVCLSRVDLVTIRHVNLYQELLGLLERCDLAFGGSSPPPSPFYRRVKPYSLTL